MEKLYLFPGNVFVSKSSHIVDTVLGSCISVTLFDPVQRFGAINHFMLPVWNGEGTASTKFGDIAIQHLITKMLEMGSNRNDLIAKVFGGSEINQPNGYFRIGARNTAIAFDILKREKIRVASHSVGGNLSRKLVFRSDNGEVLVKFVQANKTLKFF
ncbi:chemotaxis protein CheD [Desertivirga arenae]|uniref:chemotaxis protein CheD n=1 Tax=Desertivirga arenae TaxID=2810309 RepID=UPI001A97128E|nr:chemotaxis protein CheD [Pedobacter sp. SYSU D00823]